MIKYSGNTINDWWRSSSAITKVMYNGNQAYRRKVRVLPTRWVVDDTSYLCVSYDKYEKEVKEYSLDDGITWTKYIPEISRPGELIFSGSVDCGAAPQERWVVDSSSYICDGYDKYAKEVKQYALDDYGIEWVNYVPEISRKGTLIKQNARQCGYTGDTQEPCYDVASSVTAFTGEFEDAFETTSGKWYKKNNLNQYEQYGIYGTSTGGTYYEGKLVIENGYEYKYSGNTWVNIGEVSGSTATLPDVPFVLNYNAKNYDSTTYTIPMTTGQLNDTDAVAYNNPNNIVDHSQDGYITISSSSMRIRKQGQDISLFNRQSNSTDSDLTIITKALTKSECNIITNRDWNYNWMYRQYSDNLTFHGNMQTGSISCSSSNPDILSVRTYYDNGTKVKYNNWTQNTSTTPIDFTYGGTNSDDSNAGALFVGYAWNDGNEQWQGDFYWIYMAQENLTDDQVQQVIAYNESGGQSVYPVYYDEIQDPPDNVSFSSMTEAEDYECPWYGMSATIDGTDYMFCEGDEWLTKVTYVEVTGEYMCDSGNKYKKMQQYDRNADGTTSAHTPATYVIGGLIESGSTDCQHVQYEYIRTENSSESYYKFDTGFYPTEANTIEVKAEFVDTSVDWGAIIGWSSCDGDFCDSTQFRFTTVTDGYSIIARKGDTDGTAFYTVGANTPITVTLPLSASTYTYYDGISTYTCDYNIGLFSFPSSTPLHLCSIGYPKQAAVMKLYYVKIYDGNGNLVKHYVPSDNNGSPCFYEIVDGEYIMDTYTGSNHGTLTLGPAVN